MADVVFRYTATIPAGTTADAPASIALPFDGYEVQQIDLEVPAGPGGNMGFYLANNGIPWIPRASDDWIVWDDFSQTYYTDDYPNASGWAVVGYNNGQYDHSIAVTFHCVTVSSPTTNVDAFVTAFVAANIDDAISVIL